jgi:prohibitin 1
MSKIGAFLAALVVLTLLALIFVWSCCFVKIDKGNVGVLSWFGEVEAKVLTPGPYLVHPLKTVYRMSTQTQKDEEPSKVPTSNGLSVELKATLLWHLDPLQAPKMAMEVGHKDYAQTVVSTYFRNAVKDVTGEFLPEALYNQDRTKVESAIRTRVSKELESRGIVVEAVMILDPVLPQVVQERIQAKVGAEQEAQKMEYVLKQRKLEADARIVEAEGIAKAQQIIKKDLDDAYLRYLWIEALKESAKHNNATIYVPTGHDGMPFFKDASPGGKK